MSSKKGQMSYGNYPDLSNVKKVLVIKLRHLGDVLLTTPLLNALKKALPQAQIDAYLYEEAKPMLEGHPAVSHLIGYDRKWKKGKIYRRLWKELSLLRKIRREKYDLVINLTEGDRGAIAAKAASAKIRVGFDPKGRWQKKLYTHIVKHTPGLKHTVERNLDALRRIGIFPTLEERELFFKIPNQARVAIEEMTKEAPYILIHPASRWRFKCWDLKKVRQLIEHLVKAHKKVVIVSGPDPVEKEMVNTASFGLDVLNLAGKLSLKELGALIERSELLVSVDSVSFHLANALKKPVVALFGPTSEVTWGPWRNPYAKVVTETLPCRPCYQDGCGGSKYSDCLATLPVLKVLKAIETLFKPDETLVKSEAAPRENLLKICYGILGSSSDP